MESLGLGIFNVFSSELLHFTQNPSPLARNGVTHFRKFRRCSVAKSPLSERELATGDLVEFFLQDRQLNGDFISKVSDVLWKGDYFKSVEEDVKVENLQPIEEVAEDENAGGFLKLTKTQDWILGGDSVPMNRKSVAKEWQNDSERRKNLNLLQYDAVKREMLLLTTTIGAACSGYCLITLSLQAALSYATGVLFSCLYLQLLYHHSDNISRAMVPQVFMQEKSKKIGFRSDDLKNSLERTVKGSAFALSSPRLVIPAAIYGLWALSHQFLNDPFDFQLVPAMFGFFAYKAAALVQVYRDNEDLRFIFPEEDPDY
ncbi:hypothetical protein AMTRI_Chr01g103040 [Amborella trichopoda]